jgi:hypothetical protein
MLFKLPSAITAKITGTGVNRKFKIIQSKLDRSESIILINNIAYLTKFETKDKKMDLYETISLLWLETKYTE